MPVPLHKRAVAEALGAAFLLATVVGSGIMAERLSGGNVALALLANAVATGATLTALILTFGAVSGAHFNPAVTVAAGLDGTIGWLDVAVYIGAQLGGALLGVVCAHAMFDLGWISVSTHARQGYAQALSELIATFGLLAVITGVGRHRPAAVPAAVGLYITGAYWFTASTSFANPAVTIARSLTDTFAGIRPADVPAFLVAQIAGAALAVALFRWLKDWTMTPMRVLFLCTGNSARSQMAEGLLRHLSKGQMESLSAGTQPRPEVHPLAVATMRDRYGIDITAQRPKLLDAYVGQPIDYVITVCDNAAESCPVFPGDTQRIHWSFPDPAAVDGTPDEQRCAFERVAADITGRLRIWLALPAIEARMNAGA